MNVLFYSTVTRQGKTTHSVIYALHKGYKFYTNDVSNVTKELYSDLFQKGYYVEIQPIRDEIDTGEIDIDDEDNIVFDFGGFIDNRLVGILQYVDVCVIPIRYETTAEFIPFLRAVKAVEEHNKNIVLLINNTAKDLVPELKSELEKQFPKYPVFVINHSRYITRLPNLKQTPFYLAKNGGTLDKHGVKKWVLPPLEVFYQHIDNIT